MDFTMPSKPSNRIFYRGHDLVLYAYSVRNPGTSAIEWAHCVAQEYKQSDISAEDFTTKPLKASSYYHTLQSAVADLAERLRKVVPADRIQRIISQIQDGS